MRGTKHNILFILLLFFCGCLSAQETTLADSVNLAKNLMRKKGSVESMHVGAYGRLSYQCSRFLFIASKSTAAELEELLYDSSACIRLYAYAYIQSIFNKPLKSETKVFAKDSTGLFFLDGCLGGNTEVRHLLKRLRQWEKDGRFFSWIKLFAEYESKQRVYFLSE
jgi:hypothetical protein